MPRDSMNSWKAFSVSCWLWKLFSCKSYQDAWSGSWFVRGHQVNIADEVKLHSSVFFFFFFFLTFEALVVWCAVGLVLEKNWVLSVDQFRLQALQFSVHLVDLLSMLFRCNGFARIQEAVVDQMDSRPPNSDHYLFWYKFDFGKCFGASSWCNHWAGRLWLLDKNLFFGHMSQSNQEMIPFCCV